MDALLHRIEALPGDGRYAVTFRHVDGSEQTAVMQVGDGAVDVPEASLPSGWTRRSENFTAVAGAVLAVDAARAAGPATTKLRDVEGGWDVTLGNVVLDAVGTPACIAHGPMTRSGEAWSCAECGARALLA